MSGAAVELAIAGAGEQQQAQMQTLQTPLRELFPAVAFSFSAVADISELAKITPGHERMVRLYGASNTKALSWLGHGGRLPAEVSVLGYADALIDNGVQPTRAISVFPQAMVSTFAAEKLGFDMSGAALIAGACDETRAMAAGISRLGIKKLYIVDSDDAKAEAMVQLLKRKLFGIEIAPISRGVLTQVPAEASIAINLVEASESALVEDISYLNFLRDKGLWLDWTGASVALGFADEIVSTGARILDVTPFCAWREAWALDEWMKERPGGDTRPRADATFQAFSAALKK